MTLDLRDTNPTDLTFRDYAEAIDLLDAANGERPGGPSAVLSALVDVLTAEIAATTPVTPDDRAWLSDRERRAVANEWIDGFGRESPSDCTHTRTAADAGDCTRKFPAAL